MSPRDAILPDCLGVLDCASMANVVHYLEPDDTPACACDEVLVSWTYASGRATCPDCIRVLEARRGTGWLKVVLADLQAKSTGTGAK